MPLMEEEAIALDTSGWPLLEAAPVPWECPRAPLRPPQALPPPDFQAAAEKARRKQEYAVDIFKATRAQGNLERDGEAVEAPAIEGLKLPGNSQPPPQLIELRQELNKLITSRPEMVKVSGMDSIYIKCQRPVPEEACAQTGPQYDVIDRLEPRRMVRVPARNCTPC